jgi:NAD(P)-dependent dehydrogenase (short-subunit alcohol dehydrogenase family)
VWLAEQGYRVLACDISSEAVRQARQRAEAAGVDALFLVADVVVFTRGVLHTFTTAEGRAAFAAAVARCLPAAGVWLDLSGSADTPDAPGERTRSGLPRLTLGELPTAVEPYFEVLSVRRALYGLTPARTDFLAWASALRRRP